MLQRIDFKISGFSASLRNPAQGQSRPQFFKLPITQFDDKCSYCFGLLKKAPLVAF
jgi:hypothetical protein